MKKSFLRHSGFSLVEVTIALGIAGFCLIAIFGLLPIGVNSNQASIEQTVAAGIVSGFASDLRSVPKTVSSSTRFKLQIPATGSTTQTLFLKEDGTAAGVINSNANASNNPRYRATITLTAPPSSAERSATMARFLITWPALADANAGTAPSKFSGSFESMTAIDRN